MKEYQIQIKLINYLKSKKLSKLRFKMLKQDNIDSLLLVEKLKRFATDPNYIKIIKRTIIKLRK